MNDRLGSMSTGIFDGKVKILWEDTIGKMAWDLNKNNYDSSDKYNIFSSWSKYRFMK